MTDGAILPRLLRHERAIILLAVAGVTALAWLAMLPHEPTMEMPGMATMPGMPGMAHAHHAAAPALALAVAMWVVMMTGMMLPSAAPTILTFATLQRRNPDTAGRWLPTTLFVAGYLLVWGGFSVAAALLEAGLGQLAAQVPALDALAAPAAALLFLLAGWYQFTALKQACLHHCRSPFAFLLNRWRDGAGGALRMGLEHGAWCVGCCWLLMSLMLAVGAMDLLWIAALALLVFAEKLLPGGPWIARLGGAASIGWGGWLLARAAGLA